jgi:hypothetical protein
LAIVSGSLRLSTRFCRNHFMSMTMTNEVKIRQLRRLVVHNLCQLVYYSIRKNPAIQRFVARRFEVFVILSEHGKLFHLNACRRGFSYFSCTQSLSQVVASWKCSTKIVNFTNLRFVVILNNAEQFLIHLFL